MTKSEYLVRLKPYDPRRGCVLRRYTYRGIKFDAARGWYRVDEATASYLRGVHQVAGNDYSPLAFDVCTPTEAQALDSKEHEESSPKKAGDNIKLSIARDDTAGDESKATGKQESSGQNPGKAKPRNR